MAFMHVVVFVVVIAAAVNVSSVAVAIFARCYSCLNFLIFIVNNVSRLTYKGHEYFYSKQCEIEFKAYASLCVCVYACARMCLSRMCV